MFLIFLLSFPFLSVYFKFQGFLPMLFFGHLYAVGGVLFIVGFSVGLVGWLFFEESPIFVCFTLMDGPGLEGKKAFSKSCLEEYTMMPAYA